MDTALIAESATTVNALASEIRSTVAAKNVFAAYAKKKESSKPMSIGDNYSFSQFGEDKIVRNFFSSRSHGTKKRGVYVDVGCHNPYRFSNTEIFHLFHEWSGINIDLDDRAIEAFNKARPDDINLNVAVGLENAELTATIFEDGAMNSLDADIVNRQSIVNKHKILEYKKVQVRTLASILEEHLQNRQIDFLNVDAEGWDDQVLQSNNWNKYRPEIVAVEHCASNICSGAMPSSKILEEQGYTLVSWAVRTLIYKRIDNVNNAG